MSFPNARSLSALANGLGSPRVSSLRLGGDYNGYVILLIARATHVTSSNTTPQRLSPTLTISAGARGDGIRGGCRRTTAKTDVLLDMLYDGHLTLDELKGQP